MGTGLGIAAAVLLLYGLIFQPWACRWGATDEEAIAAMPGDELVPDADVTTRAVSIDAPPGRVWPWLVQIGWGRAGWYSYDWLDNDGRPSADRIIPELQHLRVGDIVPILPGREPSVCHLEPETSLVVGDTQMGLTGCYLLKPVGDNGARLISRWRQRKSHNVLALAWSLFGVPGQFLLERKMLKNIKARAERAPALDRP
ncbi:hypothetical protein BKM31_18700 [[Actinomadura] parvosata subsp. kistnae]|uniref:SRPBCC family protein n=1 Tax=[Actinomadura] parvosata subsp. kistnae TaxID=1909395 RepID=A0A1V0AJT7_9ACTN|nr:hypothetical protein BKM31_18700 [Nonomuraea sp. ATCC 55076]